VKRERFTQHKFSPSGSEGVFIYLCTMKILMVCLGNICRSPMAEGILKHKALKHGFDWTVDSAGTGNWSVGEAPHNLSQKISKQNGIDISNQKCRQFEKNDMLMFDKIYAMDNENYNDIRRMAGKLWDENKVDMLLNEAFPGKNKSIPDPWYANTDKAFLDTFNLINIACDAIIEKYASN
jgi:protein-tyrosine phosphatase